MESLASGPIINEKGLRTTFLLTAVFWTIVILLMGALHYRQSHSAAVDMARTEARSSFHADLVLSSLSTIKTGAYGPVTKDMSPSPSGKKLTMVGPNHIIRQLHGLAETEHGEQAHITSLNPLDPENAPDSWERKALLAFEKGEKEVSALDTLRGEMHLRLMRPLITEALCLNCHSIQGYKEGDIRGGVCVSVPWGAYRESVLAQLPADILGFGGIWVFGIVGLVVARYQLQRQLSSRRQAIDALRKSEARNRAIVNAVPDLLFEIDRNGVIHDCSAPDELELYALPEVVLGKSVHDILPQHAAQVAAEKIEATLKSRQTTKFEHELAIPGRQRFYETRNVALTENTVLSVVRDVTDRRQAEDAMARSEKKYRLLHESLMDGFVSVGLDGKFLECNKVYRNMLGYSETELAQLTYVDLTPERWHAYEADIVENQIMKRGYSDIYEKEYRRKDGTIFPAELHTVLTRDDHGKPVGMWAIARDITERKRAEEALRENERRLRQAHRVARLGSWEWDLSSDQLYWAEENYNMHGLDPQTVKPSYAAFLAVVDPAEHDFINQAVADALTGKHAYEIDYTVIRPDNGERRVIHSKANVLVDGSGKPLRMVGTVQDITERKRAEEQIQNSQAFLNRLIEQSPMAMWIADDQGNLMRLNQACCDLLKIKPEEVIGRYNIFKDNIVIEQGFLPQVRSVFERGETARFEIRYDSSQVAGLALQRTVALILDVAIFPIKDTHGRITNAVIQHHNITERKQAEEALKISEENYRNLYEYAPVGIYRTRIDGSKILEINNTACGMLGFTKEELFNQPSAIRWADINRRNEIIKILKEHGVANNFSADILTKAGHKMPCLLSMNMNKTAGYLEGFMLDITDRKQAEEALKQSERHFRELSECLPQLVWTCRGDGPCDYLSPQWVEYTGIPAAEQLGFAWIEQLHPDDRDRTIAAWNAAVESNKPFDVEFRIRRKDAMYRWFKTRAVALRDGEGRIGKWLGTSTDIDDQRRAEEEIRQLNAALEHRVLQRTAQLEAANKELEAFSYSVSHDLRAPLRAIDGFSNVIFEEYSNTLDAEGKRLLSVIRENISKMGHLIDDLLSLSRVGRSGMRFSPVNMTKLARTVFEELVPAAAGKQGEFTVSELPNAHADETLIRQVWTNLISNAWKFSRLRERQVMEIGGRIEGEERVYFVKDNGAGFDETYKHKLFGVFQRLHTVQKFEGTGVGLAIVKRIVTRHGGRVWAEGKVDGGATFYFTLPNTQGAEQ